MVAICIARLDNILKNFAISVSIVCSFLVDVFVFKSPVTVNVSGKPLVSEIITDLSSFLPVQRLFCLRYICIVDDRQRCHESICLYENIMLLFIQFGV